MNEYGALARSHWERWLPSRVEQIAPQDRETFFADLGERVQAQILDVEEHLEAEASSDLASLDYLERMGRLNAIRSQARESVLADLVLLDPEPGLEESSEEPDHPLSEWMDEQGMPRDRTHPLWAMLEDDETSVEEFKAASSAWETSLWKRLDEGSAGRGTGSPQTT